MDMPIFYKPLMVEYDSEDPPNLVKKYYVIRSQEIPKGQASLIFDDGGSNYIRIPAVRLDDGYHADPNFLGYDYGDTFGRNQSNQLVDWKKMMKVHILTTEPDPGDPDGYVGERVIVLDYYEWEPDQANYPEPFLYTYPIAYLGEEVEPPPDPAPTQYSAAHDLHENWFFGVVPTGQHYRIVQQNIPFTAVQIISTEGMVDVVRIDTQVINNLEDAYASDNFIGRTYYDAFGRGFAGKTADPNSWKWVLGVQYVEASTIMEVRYDAWEDMLPRPTPLRFTYYVETPA